MTRQIYTLLWAQWRQPALTLAALWAFVALFAVVIAGTGGRFHYDLLDFYVGVAWLVWVLGLVLVFEEQRTGGSRFQFPSYTFVLPVRPNVVAATTAGGRLALMAVHTVICLGPILWEDGPGGLLNAVAGTATVVLYAQGAAFLHVRISVVRALGLTLAFFGVWLLLGILVGDVAAAGDGRTSVIIAVAALPGLVYCYYAAEYAHTGRSALAPWTRVEMAGKKERRGKDWLAVFFRTPFCAQVWFEFASTAIWFPVVFGAVILPMLALGALTLPTPIDPWELNGIAKSGLGIAVALGFLWERRDRAANRFGLALPLSDSTLGHARAMACVLAAFIALVGAMAALAIPLTACALLGVPLMESPDLLRFLFSLVVSTAPVWWIGFAAGRVIFLVAVPGLVVSIAVASIVWHSPATVRGELGALSLFWVLLALTVFGLGFAARRRAGTALPWAWLGICSLAVIPALSAVIQDSLPLDRLGELNNKLLAPLLMAAATLHVAYASDLISKRLRNGLALLVIISVPVLAQLLRLQDFNTGLADADLAAYLAAGLILPFVWMPLVVRLQRRA